MARDSLAELGDEALGFLCEWQTHGRASAYDPSFVRRALHYAVQILGDLAEAEDVAQEAMLRLWRVAADWRPGEVQPKIWRTASWQTFALTGCGRVSGARPALLTMLRNPKTPADRLWP